MFGVIKRILGKSRRDTNDTPSLELSRVVSFRDYTEHAWAIAQDTRERLSFEKSRLPKTQTGFVLPGYCSVCKKPVDFLVDYQYSYEVDGVMTPNWRERLVCPGCHLNNRMRATVQIFEQEFQPPANSHIYVTEQTTLLYRWLKAHFEHVSGSEYLGDSVPDGGCNDGGIRNEDLTKLSFPDRQFDYILSFDVFEHIPHYGNALRECLRCLKPGGSLYFSVPFVKTAARNIVRATMSETGEVKHLLPPEYHGDPLNAAGCLCYHHFGWEILDELRAVGFEEAKALLYWSKDLGYLGGEQIIFAARARVP